MADPRDRQLAELLVDRCVGVQPGWQVPRRSGSRCSSRGARRVGERGIGCNPGITRYMRNTLFEEKIDGTVHVAPGNGFPDLGGTNESRIHWDIVEGLRMQGTRIELGGEVVQQDGAWLI